MSGNEKLQLHHAQILYILDLGLKKCWEYSGGNFPGWILVEGNFPWGGRGGFS